MMKMARTGLEPGRVIYQAWELAWRRVWLFAVEHEPSRSGEGIRLRGQVVGNIPLVWKFGLTICGRRHDVGSSGRARYWL